jgi:hypothetical protein
MSGRSTLSANSTADDAMPTPMAMSVAVAVA